MEKFETIKNEYLLLIKENPQDWSLSEDATLEEMKELALALTESELGII